MLSRAQREDIYEALEDEFIRLLTQDSTTKDRRRKEFNQAIFAPEEEGGYAVFNGTDLLMILNKFSQAIVNTERGKP